MDVVETLRRTPLYERHVALGARIVPFAGWEMPVQYEGVIPEHVAVRTGWGIFDVSHMGQLHVEGPQTRVYLEGVLSNELDRIEDGDAQYTLLTNERGGIVDDLIAYRFNPCRYLLVVNAGNTAAAYAWLKEREPRGVEITDVSDEYALLAVQGRSRSNGSAWSMRPRSRTPWERSQVRGDGVSNGLHGRAWRRAHVHARGCRRSVGRRRGARRYALRARRAGHATAGGLLSATRERHH